MPKSIPHHLSCAASHLGKSRHHERRTPAYRRKDLGHSDTRMVEKHYGHLAPSYIADATVPARPGSARLKGVKAFAASLS